MFTVYSTGGGQTLLTHGTEMESGHLAAQQSAAQRLRFTGLLGPEPTTLLMRAEPTEHTFQQRGAELYITSSE